MSQKEFPTHARVVIVGGGVMGVGLAYHLGHEGWGGDTVLLDGGSTTYDLAQLLLGRPLYFQ